MALAVQQPRVSFAEGKHGTLSTASVYHTMVAVGRELCLPLAVQQVRAITAVVGWHSK